MGIVWTPESRKANGGTEQLCRELEDHVDTALLDNFQIFASRVTTDLDPSKVRILWCHDRAEDPAVAHLANGGWKKFHRIVFVSHTQKNEYLMKFDIPPSRCVVMLNAIRPIETVDRRVEVQGINLIYTSTPHRGLNILIPVFKKLLEKHSDIYLDVYSSFDLYGWDGADEQFQPLFEEIYNSDQMYHHGAVPSHELRRALTEAHIFAYPSTWSETSCRCLMEAMSAGLACVHSNLGALPETAANFTIQYDYNEHLDQHASVFYHALDIAIDSVRKMQDRSAQKSYADMFYSWNTRGQQWTDFLSSIVHLDRVIEASGDTFSYRIGG